MATDYEGVKENNVEQHGGCVRSIIIYHTGFVSYVYFNDGFDPLLI